MIKRMEDDKGGGMSEEWGERREGWVPGKKRKM